MKKVQIANNITIKSLLLFSIPSIISIILEPIAGMVDTALVGRMDIVWLAALGISTTILSSFTWVFNFLIHTSTQKVAFYSGKKDLDKVYSSAKISIILSLVIGILVSFFLYYERSFLFSFFEVDEGLKTSLDEYFVPRALGHFLLIFYTCLISIFRGLSKVREAMYIVFAVVVLNILSSWLFLYPLDMGIKGPAYGTVLSNLFGVIVSLYYLFFKIFTLKKMIYSVVAKNEILQFGKNGLSLFLRSLFLTLCFFLATKVASNLGVKALASHQILLQVWLFPSFFIDGVAVTATVLIPTYMASQNMVYVRVISKNILIIGLGFGTFFTIVYLSFPSLISSIFVEDAKGLYYLLLAWPVMAIGQVLSAAGYVFDGILLGLGEFQKLARAMIVGVLFIFMPCIYLSYLKESLIYIWAGLTLLALFRMITGHIFIKQKIGKYL